MQINSDIRSKIRFTWVFGMFLGLVSCGSYQYVGVDSDGIYGDAPAPVKQQPQVAQKKSNTANSSNYYENYFKNKAQEYEVATGDGEIFTDVESYSSENRAITDTIYNDYEGNAGWGQSNDNVVVNIVDNGWNSPFFYGGFNSFGFNRGFGFNRFGFNRGFGFNRFGFNRGFGFNGGFGFHDPFFYNGFGYYDPFFYGGFNNFGFRGGAVFGVSRFNTISRINSRRGGRFNGNRSISSRSRVATNSNNLSSRRGTSSRYSSTSRRTLSNNSSRTSSIRRSSSSNIASRNSTARRSGSGSTINRNSTVRRSSSRQPSYSRSSSTSRSSSPIRRSSTYSRSSSGSGSSYSRGSSNSSSSRSYSRSSSSRSSGSYSRSSRGSSRSSGSSYSRRR